MEGVNNYEDLKYSAKSLAQFVTSDNLHYGLFLLVILIVAWKAIDLMFRPFKKRQNVMISFMKGCLKVFLAITIGMKIVSLSEALSSFTSQILMSSSLIVVVLGFVFQEGLSNVVHGFILLVFKPFQIGDRVQATIDGVSVTGYVKAIDLRSTIIENVMNSSSVIVPNSKMDLCVIDNSYFDDTKMRSNFLDFTVTYESNLDKAIEITSMEIMRHPLVAEVRRDQKIEEPVSVMVRDLGENGICLRASVITRTVEDNFAACSDIRRALIYHFSKEPDVNFAYPHRQVVEDRRAAAAAAPQYRQNPFMAGMTAETPFPRRENAGNTGEQNHSSGQPVSGGRTAGAQTPSGQPMPERGTKMQDFQDRQAHGVQSHR